MSPSSPLRVRRWSARVAGYAVAATVVTLVALPASPASAEPSRYTRTVQPVEWAYVDATNPQTSYHNPAGDVPVGGWRDTDGGYHLARSYVSYDLTGLRGKHLYDATLVGAETTVNDCTRDRHVEVWETEPIGPETVWADRPAELTRIPGPAGAEGCPAAQVTWDVAERLRAAIASGADRLTLGLRISEEHEGAVHFGRRFAANIGLRVVYNTPPQTPNDLKVEVSYNRTEPCEASSPGTYLPVSLYNGISLTARVRDTDYGTTWGTITARFAVWPVDDPTARVVRENPYADATGRSPVRVTMYREQLAENRTYAWAVQADDGAHRSEWTAPCYFTVDNTAPKQPVTSSAEYPTDLSPGTGGPGVPGTFTIRPDGDGDVVAYQYQTYFPEQPDRSGRVDAGPDGTATLNLTPSAGGYHTLVVTAIDRAGNRSQNGSFPGYRFYVRETRPSVSSADYSSDPPSGGVGVTSTFEFRSGLSGVAGYEYRLNDDPAQTVAADPSGVTTVGITPTRGGENVLTVRSYDAGKTYSPAREYRFVVPTAPLVSSDDYPEWRSSGTPNTPGTFRFAPKMPNVVAYLYQFQGEEERTVEAAADGTASVTWTPLSGGYHRLAVRSRSADGTLSEARTYYALVGHGMPGVSSTEYPADEWSGWPGRAGTFSFTPHMPGVVSYDYQFGDEGWQTVTADPDGTATITWTPGSGGYYNLNVVSRAANGARSGSTAYSFGVNSGEPAISSTDYPRYGEHGWPGKTGTFTLAASAGMPVTAFHYRWNGGEWQTVAAGADGTATLTYAPPQEGPHRLEAYGTTAEGTRSGVASYSFLVASGAPTITSETYPEWQWSGAPGSTGSFTVASGRPDVVEYEYTFDDGTTGTVPAGTDGSAVITWTPTSSGFYTLSVRARSADGGYTSYTYYYFGVN